MHILLLLYLFYIAGGVEKVVPTLEVVIEVDEDEYNATKINSLVNAEMPKQCPDMEKLEYIVVRSNGAHVMNTAGTTGT